MELEPALGIFLERIHVAAYLQDHEKRVVYLNPAATQLTGWRMTEVIGRLSHEIFGGTVACPCVACDRLAHDPQVVSCKAVEGTIRTRSGELRPVRVGVSELPNPSGTAETMVVIEDLKATCTITAGSSETTDAPRPPPLIKNREPFIDSLFDVIPDGISVLDPDLTIRRVNQTMVRWYRDRMPLVGRRCYDCYQDRIGPCVPCPTMRCLDSGQVEHEIVVGPARSPVQRISLVSFPIKDPDSGEIYQVVEFVRDITASVHLENGRKLVSEVVDRVRVLDRHLENGSLPWRTQLDELVTFCDRALSEWSDLVKTQ